MLDLLVREEFHRVRNEERRIYRPCIGTANLDRGRQSRRSIGIIDTQGAKEAGGGTSKDIGSALECSNLRRSSLGFKNRMEEVHNEN